MPPNCGSSCTGQEPATAHRPRRLRTGLSLQTLLHASAQRMFPCRKTHCYLLGGGPAGRGASHPHESVIRAEDNCQAAVLESPSLSQMLPEPTVNPPLGLGRLSDICQHLSTLLAAVQGVKQPQVKTSHDSKEPWRVRPGMSSKASCPLHEEPVVSTETGHISRSKKSALGRTHKPPANTRENSILCTSSFRQACPPGIRAMLTLVLLIEPTPAVLLTWGTWGNADSRARQDTDKAPREGPGHR